MNHFLKILLIFPFYEKVSDPGFGLDVQDRKMIKKSNHVLKVFTICGEDRQENK